MTFRVEQHAHTVDTPGWCVTRGLTDIPHPELLAVGELVTVRPLVTTLAAHVEAGRWNAMADAELALQVHQASFVVRVIHVDPDVVAGSAWTAGLRVWWRELQDRDGLPDVVQIVPQHADGGWPTDRDDPRSPLLGDIWWPA